MCSQLEVLVCTYRLFDVQLTYNCKRQIEYYYYYLFYYYYIIIIIMTIS